MKRNKKEFKLAAEVSRELKNKNVPLLILDEKWLELFPEHLQNASIREMVSELGELLKQQGKQVDELKGMKRYKSQLMQEIVDNMDVDDTRLGRLKRRKLDKNQREIMELKEEMEQKEEELAQLPYRIRQVNTELFIESTRLCYERFRSNQERIDELEEELAQLRDEVRIRSLDKQDRERKNEKMYTYLHSMLGAEVMERFDMELKKEET